MTISRPLPDRPDMASSAPARSRIAAGLLISIALHAAFMLALRRAPQASHDEAPDAARLTVRLLPPPVRLRPAPPLATPPAPLHAAAPATGPRRAPAPAPSTTTRVEAAPTQPDAPAAQPAQDPVAAPPPVPAADLMAAARHDAATFARELNKERPLRSTRQALLDRRFEDAFEAAHGWTGALPMKEVTRASDGNTRVYVLSTPLGKVCMFTRLEENPPPNSRRSPGERTYYGPCNR
jgi:hypothetical protein